MFLCCLGLTARACVWAAVLPHSLGVVRLRQEVFSECVPILTRLLLYEDSVWGPHGVTVEKPSPELVSVHAHRQAGSGTARAVEEASLSAALPSHGGGDDSGAAALGTGVEAEAEGGSGRGAGAGVGAGAGAGMGASVPLEGVAAEAEAEADAEADTEEAEAGSGEAKRTAHRTSPSDWSNFWCYFETSEEVSLIIDKVSAPFMHGCIRCFGELIKSNCAGSVVCV